MKLVLRRSFATLLSGLLVLQPVLVQAQVTPDVGAPITNQPGVGAAPNGVPLIDIVTPNSQGLSHNKYGQFNVGEPGLILNNHNGEIGTSLLGGITPGNPNLSGSGPATIILNEVTSGTRSSLLGPMEVFGGRADVIIANPNGITCDGCGFINTPRATLTTGRPDIGVDGRLSGFTVEGGDVTFGAKGGNFASGNGTVDLFDIVSRSVRIDGPVHGKDLRLTAGRNKYDYATGDAKALEAISGTPEYAIDGSALGAMQADRIKLVVTEKGAGVRMRGDMAANVGELSLSADGKIKLGNASGAAGVTLRSKQTVEARKVTSKKKVTVAADKGLTLQAIAADDDVYLNSGSGLLTIEGDIASLGRVELASGGAIKTAGIGASRDIGLSAGAGIQSGQLVSGGAMSVTATGGDIAISGTAQSGGGDLSLSARAGSIEAGSLISFGNMTLEAGNDIGITADLFAARDIVASAQSIKARAAVSGVDFAASAASTSGSLILGKTGALRLTTGGDVTMANLLSAGELRVAAGGNVAANAVSHGAMAIDAGGALNLAG